MIICYTPSPILNETGTLTITTNDATLETLELDITTERDSVALGLSKDSIALFSLCPSTASLETFILSNTGSVQNTVSFGLAKGTEFSISPTDTFSIQPGETGLGRVSFLTSIPGVYFDTLFIVSMPCGLVDTIILRGELTKPNHTVTNPIDFGGVSVGSSTQLTAQVTNNGTTRFRVSGARVIPPGSDVTISPTQVFPFRVDPGSNQPIQLTYTPTSATPIPGGTTVEIFIDSICTDTIRGEIIGVGTVPGLVVEPGTVSVGGVLWCLSESDTIWIKNTATELIEVTNLVINPTTEGFTVEWVDPTDPTPTLVVGDSVAVIVTFTPTNAPDGLKSARLDIQTDNPQIGTVSVPLRGVRLSESLQLTGPNFAPTFPGGTTQQTFMLTNNGTAPVAMNMLLPPLPFTILATRPPLPRSLAPGESMEVDIEFAPTVEGVFIDSITVEGFTTCDTLHLPISATSQAVLIGDAYWENITGEPGEVILLPLKLRSDLRGASITEYSVDASFNKTMLLPQQIILDGTLSEGWNITASQFDTGSVLFSATGTSELQDTGTLAYVEMLVLLGNDTTTEITSSDQSRFITGGARLNIASGLFHLHGYCRVGGDRLVQVTGDFGIKLVAPNPASNRVTVEFELVEDGATSLVLYDALGQTALHLIDNELKENPYRVESELDLPPGLYVLELVTPTQREQRKVIIQE